MPVIDTIKRTLGLSDSSSTAQPTSSSSSAPAAAATPAPTAASTSSTSALPTSTSDEKPTYSAKDVTVLFVLGGPGVGELLLGSPSYASFAICADVS